MGHGPKVVRCKFVHEGDEDERTCTAVVNRPMRAEAPLARRDSVGHRRGPNRATLPHEEERVVTAVGADAAYSNGLHQTQSPLEGEGARGALGRVKPGPFRTLRATLSGQRGEELANQLAVGAEVAQQIAGSASEHVAPGEWHPRVEQVSAPALERRAHRGAVASSEQSQSLAVQSNPVMAVDSRSGQQFAPLLRGRAARDAVARDAEEASKLGGSEPGPVTDQVEGASRMT